MIAAARRFLVLFSLLAAGTAAPGAVHAQLAAPIVAKPLADITVPAGTAQSSVNLKKTFALDGVTGPVVRFTTTSGVIDVALTPDVAPATVANFLNYVTRGAYTNSFFHRSVPGFIIQGGGYTFGESVLTIAADAPVVNEFNVSNTRGTIAMAKLGGDPDSATNEWFFNELDANASNLDNQNGGFTVFGHIISQAGLNVMDAIAALRIQSDPSIGSNSLFSDLPVLPNYVSGNQVMKENIVFINTIRTIPLAPKGTTGKPSLLKLAINRNSNPGLVTATLIGAKLVLNYQKGRTGTAVIAVRAKYPGGGKAVSRFTVTVQ